MDADRASNSNKEIIITLILVTPTPIIRQQHYDFNDFIIPMTSQFTKTSCGLATHIFLTFAALSKITVLPPLPNTSLIKTETFGLLPAHTVPE